MTDRAAGTPAGLREALIDTVRVALSKSTVAVSTDYNKSDVEVVASGSFSHWQLVSDAADRITDDVLALHREAGEEP